MSELNKWFIFASDRFIQSIFITINLEQFKSSCVNVLFKKSICLSVNSDEAEFTCFNENGDISSTETDVNTRGQKVWIAIDRLTFIWFVG